MLLFVKTTVFPSKLGTGLWALLLNSLGVHRGQYNRTFSPSDVLVPACPHLYEEAQLLHLQEILLEPAQPHLRACSAGHRLGSRPGLSSSLDFTHAWLHGSGQVISFETIICESSYVWSREESGFTKTNNSFSRPSYIHFKFLFPLSGGGLTLARLEFSHLLRVLADFRGIYMM